MSESNAMQEECERLSYLVVALLLLDALFIYIRVWSGTLVLSHTSCLRFD